MRSVFVIALFCMLFFSVATGAVSADPRSEIAALLSHVAQSECRFSRNGIWYSGSEASAHLERKYRYVADRGGARSAEEFIDQVATRSSITGLAYRVECLGRDVVDSAIYLRQVLRRL